MGCTLGRRVHDEGRDKVHRNITVVGGFAAGKTSVVRGLEIVCGRFEKREQRRAQGAVVRNVVIEKVRQSHDILSMNEAKPIEVATLELFECVESPKSSRQDTAEAIELLVSEGTYANANKLMGDDISEQDQAFLRKIAVCSALYEYEPSDDALLRCQWSTRGVHRHDICHNQKTIRLFDVGGTVEEQTKWDEAITSKTNDIVFVIALDILMRSEGIKQGSRHTTAADVNESIFALEHALTLCGEARPSIYVFFTKQDLLAQAIALEPIEYRDGEATVPIKSVEDAVSLLRQRIDAITKDRGFTVVDYKVLNSSSQKSMETTLTEFVSKLTGPA